MSNVNRLDAVWASMTTGDRIVLLGHDRPFLDDGDKARLTAIVEAKADRPSTALVRPRRSNPKTRRTATSV